jgi:mannose-1-phosphate guanylyltransferase
MGGHYAVIMAGGSGTRFWPASRAAKPKQFLSLGGSEETLLQATVRRATALVGIDHVFVVTGQRHASEAAEQIPELPPENLLLEPIGRNTAPCLAWACAHVRRRDPAGVIAVMPADHHIESEPEFVGSLRRALSAAETGAIVTLGIKPTRPETGYGYLALGPALGEGLYRVEAFVEKPTRERAEQFLASDRYLWNSGMFFFRADVMLGEIGKRLPELSAFVERCDEAQRHGAEADVVANEYPGLTSISIDYGVMEKAQGILVVPASFGWNDLGSWAATFELSAKDRDGNAAAGELLAIDSTGCFTSAKSGKLVVLIGLHDVVAVDTEDALLIVPRDRAQEVSKVVAALKAAGKDRQL